jgi:Relaxase/Mobilisation nuclease domain
VIAKTHKHHGAAHLISYLLRASKASQIIESSIFTPAINKSIASEEVLLDSAVRSTLATDLNQAFNRINALNPRIGKNIMHLTIGFAPEDGNLSAEFKGQIARDILENLGFGNTYWVAIAHGRDDPEHDHAHNHDHMHILASRVDSNGRGISNSWDYPKTNKILRNIEHHYELTPFVPFWEREILNPEIHWMLEIQQEEDHQQQQQRQSKSMR